MVARNRCHNDNTLLVKGEHDFRQVLGDRTFTATLPARVCPKCGEKIVEYKDLHRANVEIVDRLASEGPVSGETFRFMRKLLLMRAQQLALLLDVTPETISKWENGKTPVPRAAWMVVAEMVLDGSGKHTPMRDRLAAVAKGRRPPRRVRLDAA
jgi:hypothetical protein